MILVQGTLLVLYPRNLTVVVFFHGWTFDLVHHNILCNGRYYEKRGMEASCDCPYTVPLLYCPFHKEVDFFNFLIPYNNNKKREKIIGARMEG